MDGHRCRCQATRRFQRSADWKSAIIANRKSDHWRLIHRFALRAGLSEEQAREVVQDTVISVARNMAEFRYDPKSCTFKTWLLNVTKWQSWTSKESAAETAITRSCRDQVAPNRSAPSWKRSGDQEWRNQLLDAATRRVKELVTPKQYQMFYRGPHGRSRTVNQSCSVQPRREAFADCE